VKNPIRNETSLVLVVAVIFSAVAIPVLSGFLEPSQPPAVAVVQIGQPRDGGAARDGAATRDDGGPARDNSAGAPDDGADSSDDGADSDAGVEAEAQSNRRPRAGGARRARPPRPASPAPPAQSAPSAPADDDAAEDDGGETD
jgi:hypothetical protein